MTVITKISPAMCAACRKRVERQPTGYIAWFEWAERQAKRYEQHACPDCGRFTIWKRKTGDE